MFGTHAMAQVVATSATGNRPFPRLSLYPALSPRTSAPSSLPCASFRDPLTDGFGVNLTAAGLRQGTFANMLSPHLCMGPA
jgi:hypothetical protein